VKEEKKQTVDDEGWYSPAKNKKDTNLNNDLKTKVELKTKET